MRFVIPVLFGIVGCGILVSLGIWQVQRLAWKEGMLFEIESRILAAPVALPAAPDPDTERYLPVTTEGRTDGTELHVLASVKDMGAVYRVIAGFETDSGRRIMVDLGVIPTTAKNAARPPQSLRVIGNLHWPVETDSFTPEADQAANIWFARDVPAMSASLGTEPLLVVARELQPPVPGVSPLPVGVEGIPNDHLQYAITWFSLAVVWLGMTVFLLWRMRRTGLEG